MDDFRKRAVNPDVPIGDSLDVPTINHTTFEDLIGSVIYNFEGTLAHPERESINPYPENIQEFGQFAGYLNTTLDEYEAVTDAYRAVNPKVIEDGYTIEQGEKLLDFIEDMFDRVWILNQCVPIIVDPENEQGLLLEEHEVDEVVSELRKRLNEAHSDIFNHMNPENEKSLKAGNRDRGQDGFSMPSDGFEIY